VQKILCAQELWVMFVKVRNDYLEFYAEKKISPVHQDISNIAKHYRRREKLYRQCGVPVGLLKNKEVLEVGPGSGYNTLAFFAWNIAHVDLVEPNRTAVADMEQLFHKIDSKKYKIYPQIFEEYATQCERKYDFVVAEGFLNNLPVATDIFHKLLTFVKMGG
jgi:16S rRNA G527 N7-methylase RsmG